MIHRLVTPACTALILLVACSPQQSADFVSNEQVQNRGANKDNWWDSLPRPEWSAYERIEQDQDW
ncbi:MAG: hypothetical protein OEQ18_14530, partial [Gammaproteobacteria bacterium]|nr:hypothetical protein [Gammaproteobacteria bacterium]